MSIEANELSQSDDQAQEGQEDFSFEESEPTKSDHTVRPFGKPKSKLQLAKEANLISGNFPEAAASLADPGDENYQENLRKLREVKKSRARRYFNVDRESREVIDTEQAHENRQLEMGKIDSAFNQIELLLKLANDTEDHEESVRFLKEAQGLYEYSRLKLGYNDWQFDRSSLSTDEANLKELSNVAMRKEAVGQSAFYSLSHLESKIDHLNFMVKRHKASYIDRFFRRQLITDYEQSLKFLEASKSLLSDHIESAESYRNLSSGADEAKRSMVRESDQVAKRVMDEMLEKRRSLDAKVSLLESEEILPELEKLYQECAENFSKDFPIDIARFINDVPDDKGARLLSEVQEKIKKCLLYPESEEFEADLSSVLNEISPHGLEKFVGKHIKEFKSRVKAGVVNSIYMIEKDQALQANGLVRKLKDLGASDEVLSQAKEIYELSDERVKRQFSAGSLKSHTTAFEEAGVYNAIFKSEKIGSILGERLKSELTERVVSDFGAALIEGGYDSEEIKKLAYEFLKFTNEPKAFEAAIFYMVTCPGSHGADAVDSSIKTSLSNLSKPEQAKLLAESSPLVKKIIEMYLDANSNLTEDDLDTWQKGNGGYARSRVISRFASEFVLSDYNMGGKLSVSDLAWLNAGLDTGGRVFTEKKYGPKILEIYGRGLLDVDRLADGFKHEFYGSEDARSLYVNLLESSSREDGKLLEPLLSYVKLYKLEPEHESDHRQNKVITELMNRLKPTLENSEFIERNLNKYDSNKDFLIKFGEISMRFGIKNPNFLKALTKDCRRFEHDDSSIFMLHLYRIVFDEQIEEAESSKEESLFDRKLKNSNIFPSQKLLVDLFKLYPDHFKKFFNYKTNTESASQTMRAFYYSMDDMVQNKQAIEVSSKLLDDFRDYTMDYKDPKAAIAIISALYKVGKDIDQTELVAIVLDNIGSLTEKENQSLYVAILKAIPEMNGDQLDKALSYLLEYKPSSQNLSTDQVFNLLCQNVNLPAERLIDRVLTVSSISDKAKSKYKLLAKSKFMISGKLTRKAIGELLADSEEGEQGVAEKEELAGFITGAKDDPKRLERVHRLRKQLRNLQIQVDFDGEDLNQVRENLLRDLQSGIFEKFQMDGAISRELLTEEKLSTNSFAHLSELLSSYRSSTTLMRDLGRLLSWYLNDSVNDNRYSLADVENQQIFSFVPEGERNFILENWRENSTISLDSLAHEADKDDLSGFRAESRDSLEDHLPESILVNGEAMRADDESIEKLLSEKNKIIEEIKSGGDKATLVAYKTVYDKLISTTLIFRDIGQLRGPFSSAGDISEKITVLSKNIASLENLREKDIVWPEDYTKVQIGDLTEVKRDIESMQKLLAEGSPETVGNLEVFEADDLESLLKIGNEPVHSCQNTVNGGHNYGLMGILSGVRKTVWAKSGERLVARAVTRLMGLPFENTKNMVPIIIVDRLYNIGPADLIMKSMARLYFEKASKMNCGVGFNLGYSEAEAIAKEYGFVMVGNKSLYYPKLKGSRDYFDGGGGGLNKEQSEQNISGAQFVLFIPEKSVSLMQPQI